MKNRREFQEVKKISSKQAEQEARRFRVTIIDTKENKVMLDEETNAVMAVIYLKYLCDSEEERMNLLKKLCILLQ